MTRELQSRFPNRQGQPAPSDRKDQPLPRRDREVPEGAANRPVSPRGQRAASLDRKQGQDLYLQNGRHPLAGIIAGLFPS